MTRVGFIIFVATVCEAFSVQQQQRSAAPTTLIRLRGGGAPAPAVGALPPFAKDLLSGAGGAFGVSGVLGYAAGSAAAKATQAVSVAVGAAFLFVSLLSSTLAGRP